MAQQCIGFIRKPIAQTRSVGGGADGSHHTAQHSAVRGPSCPEADGIDPVIAEKQTLVDKMATLCITHMVQGSYAISDAYYASAKVWQPFP